MVALYQRDLAGYGERIRRHDLRRDRVEGWAERILGSGHAAASGGNRSSATFAARLGSQLHRLAVSSSKKHGTEDAGEQRTKIEIDAVGPARRAVTKREALIQRLP